MSITIGSTTFANLTAQPFGYDESNVRQGLTARKWAITGLLTPTEWVSLLNTYNAWRTLRIQDEDSKTSGVVGTTIAFSGTGAGSQTWTSVACWFSAAPSADQAGAYLSVSVELVDANQALEVLLKEEEISEEDDAPTFGTITLGTTTLTLLKPKESYAEGPSVELTTTGVHYISGPLVVQKIRDIEGRTDAAGWDGVLAWYESEIVSIPSSGDWYPISIPTVTASNKVISGVTTVEYVVSIQLAKIL
ncbi:MAG: hypothetical protein ACO24H_05225 [Polynucleobacter sp.]